MSGHRRRSALPWRRSGASGTALPRDGKLLAIGIFFAIAATNVLTPLLPEITEELGISYTTAGVLVSSYVLARLVASVLVGWVAKRTGDPALAATACGILVVGPLIGLAATNAQVLLASRVVTGIGTGILSTLALAALADLAQSRNRGRVMSLFGIAHNAGVGIYPVIGGLAGAWAGWRSTFVLMSVAGLATAAITLPVLRRAGRAAQAGSDDGPDPYAPVSPRRRAVGIAAVCTGVFAMMFNRHGFRNTLIPLYAGAVLGMGPVAISTGVTAMSLVGLVIAMPGAMAGDRWGHRRLIIGGLVALAIGDLGFLLTGDYASFLVAAAALGIGDFFMGSQTAMLASLAPPGRRTRILGGFRFATDAGALVGPVVLAILMDAFGAQAAMTAAAGVLLVAALISRLGIPTGGRARSADELAAESAV